MKIAITGHTNIEKANGKKLIDYRKYDDEIFEKVYEEIAKIVQAVGERTATPLKDMIFITGMARGVDEIFALYAMDNDLDLIAAIPYRVGWHKSQKRSAIYYEKIMDYIQSRPGLSYYEIAKSYKNIGSSYFARNQYMVDIADIVISYLKYPSRGTLDTIKRAKEAKRYGGNVTELNYGD